MFISIFDEVDEVLTFKIGHFSLFKTHILTAYIDLVYSRKPQTGGQRGRKTRKACNRETK